MKRHVEEKELPYFAATLTAYLRESHPELLSDKHFIAERSDHAAQTYERAVRNGNSVYEALELSNDFESSPSYKNLLLELTGLIQTHIELHGIQ